MDSCDDGAHATFIDGYGGVDDALGKDAFLEEAIAELHSQCAFTYDDRRDRRLAVPGIEAKLFEATLEEVRVLPEPINEARVFF